jgi:hypothetical protein
LVALAIYAVKRGGFYSHLELYSAAVIAAFASLWLVAGLAGSQGTLRYDPMKVFYMGALGVCAVLLLCVERWSL